MQCILRIAVSLRKLIKRLCVACLWIIAFVAGGVCLALAAMLLWTLTFNSRPNGYYAVIRLEKGASYAEVKEKILDGHKWDRNWLYYEPDIYKRIYADHVTRPQRQGFILEATRNRGFSNGYKAKFVFDDCNRLVWAEVSDEFAYRPRWAKQGPVVLPRLDRDVIFPLYEISGVTDRYEIMEGGARFVLTIILQRNKNASAFPMRLTEKPALVVENGVIPSGAVHIIRRSTSDGGCVQYDIELDGENHDLIKGHLKVVIKFILPKGMPPVEYDFDFDSIVGQKIVQESRWVGTY